MKMSIVRQAKNRQQTKKSQNLPNLVLVPHSVLPPSPLPRHFVIINRVSADGFEIDISYPEEFKNVALESLIPTPLPNFYIERQPVKLHDPEYWEPMYPAEETKHEKRSLEKRHVGDYLCRNKFAILTGAALFAGGTWLWNWWKTRKVERAAEKAALEAVRWINNGTAARGE
jgi:hypothetical protein